MSIVLWDSTFSWVIILYSAQAHATEVGHSSTFWVQLVMGMFGASPKSDCFQTLFMNRAHFCDNATIKEQEMSIFSTTFQLHNFLSSSLGFLI